LDTLSSQDDTAINVPFHAHDCASNPLDLEWIGTTSWQANTLTDVKWIGTSSRQANTLTDDSEESLPSDRIQSRVQDDRGIGTHYSGLCFTCTIVFLTPKENQECRRIITQFKIGPGVLWLRNIFSLKKGYERKETKKITQQSLLRVLQGQLQKTRALPSG
jgi:hypothetical protein